MADVVREALRRIRATTGPARALAHWYEANPTRLYLPPELEHLRSREFLQFEEIAELLGLDDRTRSSVDHWVRNEDVPVARVVRVADHTPARVVRFANFERHMVAQLPP